MIRKIIHIDEEKCNGCGLCATACHEGAIDIINGKAKLVRENFCDGFGDCCRAAPPVLLPLRSGKLRLRRGSGAGEQKEKRAAGEDEAPPRGRLPRLPDADAGTAGGCRKCSFCPVQPVSRLRNWPVQIKLAPIHAPYFEGAKLLIAADCTAYAYANFHQEFMRGKVTLIGCPKLDAVDYSEKLTEILRSNDIQSVTILRMEVPCCGGLEMAAKKALQASGKFIPWQVVTISIDGKILD